MKPMLASPVELDEVKFPVLASPKLDGIRAIVREGQLLSRKLEKIPNEHIQAVVKSWGPSANGLDGELIIGKVTDPKVFNTTQSGVMRISGKPSFSYHVFDLVDEETPFLQRLANLKARLELLRRPEIVLVPQVLIGGQAELKKIEADILKRGYEGTMVRAPQGRYKFGRSTVLEGYLLKRKPIEDAEGKLIRCERAQSNCNLPTKNKLGQTKRSTAQSGMVPVETLGTLIVSSREDNEEIRVSPGRLSHKDREHIWCHQDAYIGKTLTYMWQSSGSKDKPRFARFKAWRDERDMS